MNTNTETGSTSASLSDADRVEMLSEWNSLRTEIIKRIEIRHQVLSLALIVAGTLITFGAQERTPVVVLLLYPLLAIFLAIAWMHSDMRISEIAKFIRTQIEPKLNGLRWEAYIKKKQMRGIKNSPFFAKATEMSANGIFVFTELLAIVLAWTKLNYSFLEILLVLVDVGVIFLTVMLIRRRRSLCTD